MCAHFPPANVGADFGGHKRAGTPTLGPMPVEWPNKDLEFGGRFELKLADLVGKLLVPNIGKNWAIG